MAKSKLLFKYLTLLLLFLRIKSVFTRGQDKILPTRKPTVGSTVIPTLLHNDPTKNHLNNDGDISMAKSPEIKDDKHNITKIKIRNHTYYKSIINPDNGRAYWVDLSNRSGTKIKEYLLASYRRASRVEISFEFPFFGHLIKNVTIATGGFLYTSNYVHLWLAATQYIAPLMANFDTSISNDSLIRYSDNGTSFTVEWYRVSLRDRPEGEFTFQTTLYKNGDIVFVYENVPDFIKQIKDDHHPVKIGLFDAYLTETTIFSVHRKAIYEYYRINFDREDIKNWTVIYLKALPTCLDNKDCYSCSTRKIPNFKCGWCSSVERCSNGVDRGRHEWLREDCDKKQITNETMCTNLDDKNSEAATVTEESTDEATTTETNATNRVETEEATSEATTTETNTINGVETEEPTNDATTTETNAINGVETEEPTNDATTTETNAINGVETEEPTDEATTTETNAINGVESDASMNT